MTEHETYVQALRALRRLRSKSLIANAYFSDGEVCVAGALGYHLSSKGVIERFDLVRWNQVDDGSAVDQRARVSMTFENDDFEGTPKARYRHMVKWLENRIKETAA